MIARSSIVERQELHVVIEGDLEPVGELVRADRS